jgi:hypothetical protein
MFVALCDSQAKRRGIKTVGISQATDVSEAKVKLAF